MFCIDFNQESFVSITDKEKKEESSKSKDTQKTVIQHWETTSDLSLEERRRRGNEALKEIFSMKKIPMAPDAD